MSQNSCILLVVIYNYNGCSLQINFICPNLVDILQDSPRSFGYYVTACKICTTPTTTLDLDQTPTAHLTCVPNQSLPNYNHRTLLALRRSWLSDLSNKISRVTRRHVKYEKIALQINGSILTLILRRSRTGTVCSTLLPATREQHDQNCTQSH